MFSFLVFNFIFCFVLLLLVLNIKIIGLYSVYYWYCIVIVHFQTYFINGSNPWMVSRITHIINIKWSSSQALAFDLTWPNIAF